MPTLLTMRQLIITKLEQLMYEDADSKPRHDGNIAAAAWTCEDDMAIVRYYDEMENVKTLIRMGGTNVSATANYKEFIN